MIRLPILLIHGFNGAPTNWTGPSDRFPDFLVEHGFDPDLIRVFSYGYDTSITFPIVDEHCLQVDVGRRASSLVQFTDNGEHPIPIHRHLRSLPAARRQMLAILIGNDEDQGEMPNGHDAMPAPAMGRVFGRDG